MLIMLSFCVFIVSSGFEQSNSETMKGPGSGDFSPAKQRGESKDFTSKELYCSLIIYDVTHCAG